MTLLTWIIRIIIVAIVLRLVLRMFTATRVRPGARRSPRPVERVGGPLVRDPQCGTYVPKATALVVGRGDQALHFCSAGCRDEYLAAHSHRHAS
jgi:hypothetical protein